MDAIPIDYAVHRSLSLGIRAGIHDHFRARSREPSQEFGIRPQPQLGGLVAIDPYLRRQARGLETHIEAIPESQVVPDLDIDRPGRGTQDHLYVRFQDQGLPAYLRSASSNPEIRNRPLRGRFPCGRRTSGY